MEFTPAELVLNSDNSVYHLALHANEVAEKVILVGDPGRVAMVASHFDEIEVKRHKREFVTHTGWFKGKRISVVSTGIGTDNIDIVLNELDILAGVDLEKRERLESKRKLRFVRLGTCGILQENIPVGAFIQSRFAIGFDSLMHFYKLSSDYDTYHLSDQLKTYFSQKGLDLPFYLSAEQGSFDLRIPERHIGITATLPGFYGPQGRVVNAEPKHTEFLQTLNGFSSEQHLRLVNFEMECSGLFGLAAVLGHDATTVCLGLANRITGEFLKEPKDRMEQLIEDVIEAI